MNKAKAAAPGQLLKGSAAKLFLAANAPSQGEAHKALAPPPRIPHLLCNIREDEDGEEVHRKTCEKGRDEGPNPQADRSILLVHPQRP
jgi:hypothetical protein